ncbi:MAG: peptidoglycan-binding protein [Clostridia bacterium]|nr:peptidoglycan-binding protein [Clostridia bacterium]
MGRGYDVGKAGADGEFGEATDKAVRAAQKAHGLTVDGIAGKDTLAALWRG